MEPFNTALIVGSSCFLLGILFNNWNYDYATSWIKTHNAVSTDYSKIQSKAGMESDMKYMLALLHYANLHTMPDILQQVLHVIMLIGYIGFYRKLSSGKQSMTLKLFDTAAVILYSAAILIYECSYKELLKTAFDFLTSELLVQSSDDFKALFNGHELSRQISDVIKTLALNQAMMALTLLGMLGLQGSQFYIQRQVLDQTSEHKTPIRLKGSISFDDDQGYSEDE